MRPSTLPLLFAATLVSVPVGEALLPDGKHPDQGTCDETDILVCAGADVGTDIACTQSGAVASCAGTYGYLWESFSPLLLPGSAVVSRSTTTSSCISGACTSTTAPAGESCEWLPAGECQGSLGSTAASGPITLALGQCLLFSVSQTVTVTAQVVNEMAPLASVTFSFSGTGGGQTCYVDDGR